MSPAPDPSLRLKNGCARDDAGQKQGRFRTITSRDVIPKPRVFSSGARDLARSSTVCARPQPGSRQCSSVTDKAKHGMQQTLLSPAPDPSLRLKNGCARDDAGQEQGRFRTITSRDVIPKPRVFSSGARDLARSSTVCARPQPGSRQCSSVTDKAKHGMQQTLLSPAPDPSLRLKNGSARDDAGQEQGRFRTITSRDVIPKPRAFSSGARDLARSSTVCARPQPGCRQCSSVTDKAKHGMQQTLLSPAPDPSLRLKNGCARDDAGQEQSRFRTITSRDVIPKPRAFTSGARDLARSSTVCARPQPGSRQCSSVTDKAKHGMQQTLLSPAPDPSLRLKNGCARDDAGQEQGRFRTITSRDVIPKPRVFSSGARDLRGALQSARAHSREAANVHPSQTKQNTGCNKPC